MSELTTSIASIDPAETHLIRHRILRPNQDLSASVYPLDEAPRTLHAGCFMAGNLVGIASIFHEAPNPQIEQKLPAGPYPEAWRLRGLAVVEAARGVGVGAHLIKAVMDHAGSFQDEGMIWCKVRLDALDYLARYRFEAVGEVFENESLGPHRIMIRPLPAQP